VDWTDDTVGNNDIFLERTDDAVGTEEGLQGTDDTDGTGEFVGLLS
jgi:hypothetical protein